MLTELQQVIETLEKCKEKLHVYYVQTDGEWSGGPRYASLLKEIDRAIEYLKEHIRHEENSSDTGC